MRFASLLLAAAFVAASGTAMADQMSGASPKPSAGAMHSSMKSSSMKNSSSMKSQHNMKSSSGSSSMKSSHSMASPKPTMKP